MKSINLYVPKMEDLWFRQTCMEDAQTMEYNAGYEVSYDGYHKNTGCIDFPKEKWEAWHAKIENGSIFYAYIVVDNKFVGYVNFKKTENPEIATMGILIKASERGKGYMRPALELLFLQAKKQNVKVLKDTVPKSRQNALKVFFDFGFKKTAEFKVKKFGKNEIVFEIEKKL